MLILYLQFAAGRFRFTGYRLRFMPSFFDSVNASDYGFVDMVKLDLLLKFFLV